MKVKFEMDVSNEEGMELFKMLCQIKGVEMVALKEEKEPSVTYPVEPCVIHHEESATLSEVAQYHVGVDLASTPDTTAVVERVVQPLPIVMNYVAPYAGTQTPNVPAPAPAPAPAEVVVDTAPVPTINPAETYTLEQLAVAASTQLVDAGRRNELIDLLGLFGIQSMAQLPLESYGLFATHLRSKGVRV